jgi:hypothetical protein
VAKLCGDVREIKYNSQQEIAVLEKSRKNFENAFKEKIDEVSQINFE